MKNIIAFSYVGIVILIIIFFMNTLTHATYEAHKEFGKKVMEAAKTNFDSIIENKDSPIEVEVDYVIYKSKLFPPGPWVDCGIWSYKDKSLGNQYRCTLTLPYRKADQEFKNLRVNSFYVMRTTGFSGCLDTNFIFYHETSCKISLHSGSELEKLYRWREFGNIRFKYSETEGTLFLTIYSPNRKLK